MIINNININSDLNQEPLCLTIGNFDGIHLGHQFIINEIINNSKKLNLKSAVLSFSPHPRVFFKKVKENFNIITDVHKEELLESLGIDIFFKLKFDEKIASMSPEDFINKFLINKLNLKSLIIGENFRFGINRSGDINLLKKIYLEKKFYLKVINFVKTNDTEMIFSSSIIREKIKKGEFSEIYKFLGRPWTIKGTVIKGEKRAREMNFPTANILSPDTIHPKKGVYIVKVIIDGKKYSGIANFGRRPTFGGKKVLLEVNIFDFNDEIYGKELTIEFLTFIREEIEFANFDKLKEQVNKAVQSAKFFFTQNR